MILAAAVFALLQVEDEIGVTIPVDRSLPAKFREAAALRDSDHPQSAIHILQPILGGDPATLVETPDPAIFVGAAWLAHQKMMALPAAAQTAREFWLAKPANEALLGAILPPQEAQLIQVAQQFAGLPAGQQANLALAELRTDRGYALGEKGAGGIYLPQVDSMQDSRLPLLHAKDLQPAWNFTFQNPRFGGVARMHRMAIADGIGFVTNGVEVIAIQLSTGKSIWNYDGPPGWQSLSPAELQTRFEGASPDTLLIPVVADGLLLVVLQEPIPLGRQERRLNIAVRRILPARRLYALDLNSGAVIWKMKVPWKTEMNPLPRSIAAAPPAVRDGRVFLPLYDAMGTLDLSLVALDLATGKPIWKRFLVSGQQESNLFGNIIRETACAPPLVQADSVVVATHLGAICSLDPATGMAQWTRVYPRTSVKTFQTGREAIRQDSFANGPMLQQGQTLIVAPLDGKSVEILDSQTGQALAQWPQKDPLAGPLRHLLGLVGNGVWMSGLAAVYLPLPGKSERRRQSPPLYDRVGIPAQRQPGILARNEVLIPSLSAWELLDPTTAKRLATLTEGYRRHLDYGAMQVAPGMLFILHHGGVTAWKSSRAVMEALVAWRGNEKDLAELLPYLESIPTKEVEDQKRLAAALATLTSRVSTPELKKRCHLLQTKAHYFAGLPLRSTWCASVTEFLRSPAPAEQLVAVMLTLDGLGEKWQQPHSPQGKLIQSATAWLKESKVIWIPRVKGPELREISLARLSYFQAKDAAKKMDALLAVLRLSEMSDATQGDLPLQIWAQNELLTLTRVPTAKRRWENLAGQLAPAVEFSDPTFLPSAETFLRTFGASDFGLNWLSNLVAQIKPSSPFNATAFRWARNYGGERKSEFLKTLNGLDFFKPAKVLEPPSSFTSYSKEELRDEVLLGVTRREDGIYLMVQRKNRLRIRLWGDRQAKLDYLLPLSGVRLPDLRGRAFLHEEGATVVVGSALVHLKKDGDIQIKPLNGFALDLQVLNSTLLALTAQEGSGFFLEVHDFLSKEKLLSLPVPLKKNRHTKLITTQDAVWILQEKVPTAFKVSLPDAGEVLSFPLPFLPTSHDIESTVPFQDGIAIPGTQSAQPFLVFFQNGEFQQTTHPSMSRQKVFGHPQGIGIALEPLTPGLEPFPAPQMSWWKNGQSEAHFKTLAEPSPRIPSLEFYGKPLTSAHPSQILFLRGKETGEIAVQAQAFSEQDVLQPLWDTTLKQYQFQALARRMPAPWFGDQRWLLSLSFSSLPGQPTPITLILFSQKGQILDEFQTATPSNSTLFTELIPLEDSVVLRTGNQLHLLGEY